MRHAFIRRPVRFLLEGETRLCFKHNAPNAVPSAELPKPENKILAFFRSIPLLGSAVSALISPVDITDEASISAMVDHGQWITALQEADVPMLTTKPAEAFDPKVAVTPQALFRAMTPDQRRDVFFEYLDFFVPRQAQTDLQDENGAYIKDSKARVVKLGDAGIAKYKRALLGIVGVDTLEDAVDKDARELATKALATHFRMGMFPGMQVRGLDLQYADAMKRNGFKGREPFATMPQALRDKVPASAFRGALNLGVIGTNELKALNDTFLRHQQDIDVVHAQTASRLDQMGNLTSKRLREEAKGMVEIWGELGGFEKLVLVAAGAFLLSKKPGRYAAMCVAGVYFLHRFVFKNDDPMKSWSDNFNKGLRYFADTKMIKDTLDGAGYQSSNAVDDSAKRAEIVVKFLDSFNRLNMESQAQGLAIMLEMPMDVLARNFLPTGPGTFALNLDASGTVDDSIRRMDPAMRRAFSDFFRVPSNREMASEAMAYVFYRKAAEDPQNRPDVELIEHVLDRLPSGSISMPWRVDGRPEGGASHSRLPHAETQYLPQNGPSVPNTQGVPNAHSTPNDPAFDDDIKRAGAAYVHLVDRGRDMALGDGTTLRMFMKTTFDFKAYTADRSTSSFTRNVAGSAVGNSVGIARADLSGLVSSDVALSATGDRAGRSSGNVSGAVENDRSGVVHDDLSGRGNDDVSGSPRGDVSGEANDDASGRARGDAANAPRDDASGSVRDDPAGGASDDIAPGPREKRVGEALDARVGSVRDGVSGSAPSGRAGSPDAPRAGSATDGRTRGGFDSRSGVPNSTRSGAASDRPSGMLAGDASGNVPDAPTGTIRLRSYRAPVEGVLRGPVNNGFSAPRDNRSGPASDTPSFSPFGDELGIPRTSASGSPRGDANGSTNGEASGSAEHLRSGSPNEDASGTSKGRLNGTAEGE
jgi:hypothetical protein